MVVVAKSEESEVSRINATRAVFSGRKPQSNSAEARGFREPSDRAVPHRGSDRSGCSTNLPDTSFQFQAQQFVGFSGELHRQVIVDFFAKAAHQHRDRIFFGNPALSEEEELILANFCR